MQATIYIPDKCANQIQFLNVQYAIIRELHHYLAKISVLNPDGCVFMNDVKYVKYKMNNFLLMTIHCFSLNPI